MRIEADTKLAYRDVLIKPKRSTLKSRSEVSLTRTYRFRHAKRTWTGVPVMAANMDSVATFEMAEALATHECFTCIHKHYSIEEWTTWAGSDSAQAALPFTAVSCGTSEADFAKVKEVVGKTKVRFVCADVANGYSEHFVEFIKRARADLPEDVVIIAGNVCSPEMTEELVLAGADIVKIGIGPGSACKTRSMTGVGYPQLSAVIECADAAHGLDGLVIADGGCTCPGDVAKAFGGGADFVMLGGMLAGHDECGGEVGVDEETGEKFKVFYGMSSTTAQKKYAGGVAGYRASEGKTVRVPYRGPVLGTMLDVLGGLRSTCTYVGAPHLKELSKRTTFVRCTIQLNEVFSSAKHRADAGTGMKRLPEAAGDGADAKRAKK